MQTRSTQFIDTIVNLSDQDRQSNIAKLSTLICDEGVLRLAHALASEVEKEALVEQIEAASLLFSLLTRGEIQDVAFAAFKGISSLTFGMQTPKRLSSELEDSDAESEDEFVALRPTPGNSSPNNSSTIFSPMFSSRSRSADYSRTPQNKPAMEEWVAIIPENQSGLLIRVKNRLEAKLIKPISNFSQFLLFILLDALGQLHEKVDVWNLDLPDYATQITGIVQAVQDWQDFLILLQPIDTKPRKEALEAFLERLANAARPLKPKNVSLPQTGEEGIVSAEVNTMATVDLSPQSQSVYPMPDYLAKEFQKHFADAILEDMRRVNQHNRLKASEMHAAGQALGSQSNSFSILRNMYDLSVEIESENKTLRDILTEQKNEGEGHAATSFSRTLLKAGISFIEEDPASLMRRYVFLTQLGAETTFVDKSQADTYQEHLNDVIYQMSKLRKRMRDILSPKTQPARLVGLIKRLKTLAEAYKAVDIHARLLAVVCLGRLHSSAFAELNNSSIQQWLVGKMNPATQKAFIEAAVRAIEYNPAVKNHGIRAWEKALLELTSFHQARYPEDSYFAKDKAYTAEEHQANVQAAILRLGACIDLYFNAKASAKDAKPILDLSLCVYENDNNSVKNTQGAEGRDTRLRLITNLKKHWQAVLSANASVGSMTATTLALAQAGNRTALRQWGSTLIDEREQFLSPEGLVNYFVIKSLYENPVDITDEIFICFQHEKSIDDVSQHNNQINFDHRIRVYWAIIEFSNILRRHLSKLTEKNQHITRICAVIQGSIDRLLEVIKVETAVLQSLMKEGQPSALIAKHRVDYISLSLLLESNVGEEISRRARQLILLQEAHQECEAQFIALCFPIKRNKDGQALKADDTLAADELEYVVLEDENIGACIAAVRKAIYKESVTHPKAGPKFRVDFEKAVKAKDDQFFIDVLFTLHHHPIDAVKVKWVCKKINEAYQSDKREFAEKWSALEGNFYENGDALQALCDYYLNLNTKEAFNKALKIALFGFKHEAFLAFKVLFARKIMTVLANLNVQEEKDIPEGVDFDDILSVLVASDESIASVEEANHIISLSPQLGKRNSFDDQRNAEILFLRAKKYVEVEKFLGGIYKNYKVAVLVSHEEIKDLHEKAVHIAMNVGAARKQAGTLTEHTKELDRLIENITDTCFAKDYRYYERPHDVEVTKANKVNYKLTNQNDRSKLIKRCQEKIAALLKTNTLDSKNLKAAMNELRAGVLQGGSKDTLERLEAAPHEILSLTDKEFGYQESDFFLKNFYEKFFAIKKALTEEKRQELQSNRASLRIPLVSSVSEGATLDEVNNETYQITPKAILAVIDWFDKEAQPLVDHKNNEGKEVVGNASPGVHTHLDITPITQANIDAFIPEYIKIGYTDPFQQRIAYLRQGRFDWCYKHIIEHKKESDRSVPNFVNQLNDKDSQGASNPYQDCLEYFIWSLAEKAADEAPAYPNLDRIAEYGYNWADLIYFGCKRYAAMTPDKRFDKQKGERLLKTLVYLAKQELTSILDEEEVDKIGTLKSHLITLVADKLSSRIVRLSEEDIKERAEIYLLNWLRGIAPSNKAERAVHEHLALKEDSFCSDHRGRRAYAEYLSIKALENPEITKDGTSVYYHIYTLAQAWRCEENAEEHEGFDLGDDERDEVDNSAFSDSQSDFGSARNLSIPSSESDADILTKVNQLLNQLHANLSEKGFATWHRDMLDISKHFPSSLHVLIRHKPHPIPDWQEKIEASHNPNSPTDLELIEEQPYFWTFAYCKNKQGRDLPLYDARFSYEALAVYELKQLLQLSEFRDQELSTTYQDRNGKVLRQCNRPIEQQALVFRAVKDYFDENNINSPFREALRMVAQVSTAPEEVGKILDNLLSKACDSFNAMLNSDNEAKYGLNVTFNVSLKREIKRWIKSTPQLAGFYSHRTQSVHSREQADFVFDVFVSNTELSVVKIDIDDNARIHPLLEKAFDWHYNYIDLGRENSFLDTAKARLKSFKALVDKKNLWQPYYRYIADKPIVNMASFAKYDDYRSNPFIVDHANMIFEALEAHPCEDKDVLTGVLAYILQSWISAIENSVYSKKDAAKCFPKMFDRCVKCYSCDGNSEATLRTDFWATYRDSVPGNIKVKLVELDALSGSHYSAKFKKYESSVMLNTIHRDESTSSHSTYEVEIKVKQSSGTETSMSETPKEKKQSGSPERSQGYVQHEVAADGNCGYTAFGITREDAHEQLLSNLASIKAIISLPVKEALLTKEFHTYLTDKVVLAMTQEAIRSDEGLLEDCANREDVQRAYINYDVQGKRIDEGWAHPRILQALAHIRGIELHMWCLGENEVLVPHIVGDENYADCTPDGATERVDLLFVNGNHFERLDFTGYDTIPNQGIYPIRVLSSSKNASDDEGSPFHIRGRDTREEVTDVENPLLESAVDEDRSRTSSTESVIVLNPLHVSENPIEGSVETVIEKEETSDDHDEDSEERSHKVKKDSAAAKVTETSGTLHQKLKPNFTVASKETIKGTVKLDDFNTSTISL